MNDYELPNINYDGKIKVEREGLEDKKPKKSSFIGRFFEHRRESKLEKFTTKLKNSEYYCTSLQEAKKSLNQGGSAKNYRIISERDHLALVQLLPNQKVNITKIEKQADIKKLTSKKEEIKFLKKDPGHELQRCYKVKVAKAELKNEPLGSHRLIISGNNVKIAIKTPKGILVETPTKGSDVYQKINNYSTPEWRTKTLKKQKILVPDKATASRRLKKLNEIKVVDNGDGNFTLFQLQSPKNYIEVHVSANELFSKMEELQSPKGQLATLRNLGAFESTNKLGYQLVEKNGEIKLFQKIGQTTYSQVLLTGNLFAHIASMTSARGKMDSLRSLGMLFDYNSIQDLNAKFKKLEVGQCLFMQNSVGLQCHLKCSPDGPAHLFYVDLTNMSTQIDKQWAILKAENLTSNHSLNRKEGTNGMQIDSINVAFYGKQVLADGDIVTQRRQPGSLANASLEILREWKTFADGLK